MPGGVLQAAGAGAQLQPADVARDPEVSSQRPLPRSLLERVKCPFIPAGTKPIDGWTRVRQVDNLGEKAVQVGMEVVAISVDICQPG